MTRGRPKKNIPMPQQEDKRRLPAAEQGDVINMHLEITRVTNGYIVKNADPEAPDENVMVFNGENAHRMVSGHVFGLAVTDMKPGETINFNSQLTYTKKIKNEDQRKSWL